MACTETSSHSLGPGNIRAGVRVSFTTGALRSAILATAGLLVENCLDLVNHNKSIILGDMNFECVPIPMNHGYRMFKDFCDDMQLQRADSVCGSLIDCTYYQESTSNSSVIDHIFVNKNMKMLLLNTVSLMNLLIFLIISRLCVNLKLTLWLTLICSICTIMNLIINLINLSAELLQGINIPLDLLECECDVFGCLHFQRINSYYNSITEILQLVSV